MRVVCVGAFGLCIISAVACFNPKIEGAACAADGTCPSGFDCVAGTCRSSGGLRDGNAGDGGATDGRPDAASGCLPNVNYCVGDKVFSCFANGTQGSLLQECALGLCIDGACIDTCAAARSVKSYFGCEYWPVDLDNAVEVLGLQDATSGCALTSGTPRSNLKVCNSTVAASVSGLCDPGDVCPPDHNCELADVCVFDAQTSPFGIVVTNPNPGNSVTVTIRDKNGTSANVLVDAGAVVSLLPQQVGLADMSVDGTGQTPQAYRLTSTAPIVAYQYNPLDNVDVFSNDASLLIPAHSLGTDYYAVTQPATLRRPNSHNYAAYVTVVATEEGSTQVRVTPTAAVVAGGSVAAIAEGESATFTLAQYDVLNLEALAGDLSGTRVVSVNGAPFAAFAGHEASSIGPSAATKCCADHLEEQLFPDTALGAEYAVPRSQSRVDGDFDVVRIVATTAGTTLAFEPAPAVDNCAGAAPLAAGQWCEVHIATDVVVAANQPIVVAQFLTSVITVDMLGTSEGNGDPSMALVAATNRARRTYTFLVPAEYEENHIAVSAPAGTTVLLDDIDVSTGLTVIGSSGFVATRVPVSAGVHTLDCRPNRCAVQVHGYSTAVSYMFAAGLDFTD